MNFLFCSSQKIMQPFHSWRLYSFARKVTVAHAMLVGKQFLRHWEGTVFLNTWSDLWMEAVLWKSEWGVAFSSSQPQVTRRSGAEMWWGSAIGPLAKLCKLLKNLTHTDPVSVRDTTGENEEFQHWKETNNLKSLELLSTAFWWSLCFSWNYKRENS